MSGASQYDAWYETERGRWIGGLETALILRMLHPRPAESLLDVGCGTGYFTRKLAAEMSGPVVGLDPDEERIAFARRRACCGETYQTGSALDIPFASKSMDLAMSITALCFISGEDGAVSEMVRVARRRVALGLLGSHSLLFAEKGRGGGRGAYRGARWHTARAARELAIGAGLRNVAVRSAVFFPSGSALARRAERIVPERTPFGGFLLVTGDVR